RVAESHLIGVVELLCADPDLVDERAVRRAQILDPPVAAVVAKQPRVLARHRAAADHEAGFAVATDDVLAIEQRDPPADIGPRRMQVDEARLSGSGRRLLVSIADWLLEDERPATVSIVFGHLSPL